MATTKKRRATRSRAATASEHNVQAASAELAQFRLRIDAALRLADYEDAPEDARLARSFLGGAEQAIGDRDAVRAFRCCNVMRDLLIRLEAAPFVSRGTRNDVLAVELENRDQKSGDARRGSRRAEPADVVREVESRRQTGMKVEAAYIEVGELYPEVETLRPLSAAHIKRVYLKHRPKNVEHKPLRS
jgi:hypothetical protein